MTKILKVTQNEATCQNFSKWSEYGAIAMTGHLY